MLHRLAFRPGPPARPGPGLPWSGALEQRDLHETSSLQLSAASRTRDPPSVVALADWVGGSLNRVEKAGVEKRPCLA
jgi:hypothetical protein